MSAVKVLEFLKPETISSAMKMQENFRKQVITGDVFPKPLKNLLAMDVSYLKAGNYVGAVAMLFSYPELLVLEEASWVEKSSFPYIPGLLAFRELPPLLEAIKKINSPIDMLLVEGQGIAHPRRFGLASHLGVLLDIPAVGCCKNLLWGRHQGVENTKGAGAYIYQGEEIIGLALRTRESARPLYVSIGHRVSLTTARDLVMSLVKNYRLPEPLRMTHNKAKFLLKENPCK